MSKNIRNQATKLAVLFATSIALSSGVMGPLTYLKATTVNAATSVNNAPVTIGETTLTFNGIKLGESDDFGTTLLIDATFERAKGIPAETTDMWMHGKGKVTINSKQYNLDLSSVKNIERISDTKVKAQIAAVPSYGNGADSKLTKDITPEVLKGQKIDFTIDYIDFSTTYNKMTKELSDLLKNIQVVQGVAPNEGNVSSLGNMTEAERKADKVPDIRRVLPKKGLGVQLVEGSNETIDNIGFVDGRLQIRTNGRGYVSFKDANGKPIQYVGFGLDTNGSLDIYEIKDLAALSKCSIQASVTKHLVTEDEEKSFSVTF